MVRTHDSPLTAAWRALSAGLLDARHPRLMMTLSSQRRLGDLMTRGPVRGPSWRRKRARLVFWRHRPMPSLQVERSQRLAGLLLTRWFRVRPPGAPLRKASFWLAPGVNGFADPCQGQSRRPEIRFVTGIVRHVDCRLNLGSGDLRIAGARADFCHSGTARTKTYGVDASPMVLQRHG